MIKTMKENSKMKIAALIFVLLLGFSLSGFAQLGKIHGTVKNGASVEAGATVELYKDNAPTGKGVITKADGKYEFALLDPGTYTVKITIEKQSTDNQAIVSPGESQKLDFDMALVEKEAEGGRIGDVDMSARLYDKEIFTKDPVTFITYTKLDIQQGGQPRGIKDIAALSPGITQKDHGSPLNFRGAREGTSAIYVDNRKVRGSDEMPLPAIEQMTVMSGGIPAEYGDVTGGIIVITTGNPGMNGYFGNGVSPKAAKAARKLEKALKKEPGSGCNCDDDFLVALAY